MGRAKRNPSTSIRSDMMGFATLYPSYKVCVRGYRNFPRAVTGSAPMISSPRTITTSSIMLTTTQT
ncbi:hypothetical protein ACVIYL_007314 [Bradyrhizobium sp. USDA 3315]